MQALKNLFSRTQAPQAPQAAAPVQQLTELSADSLKQVAGGLPRVSQAVDVTIDPTELPRVS